MEEADGGPARRSEDEHQHDDQDEQRRAAADDDRLGDVHNVAEADRFSLVQARILAGDVEMLLDAWGNGGGHGGLLVVDGAIVLSRTAEIIGMNPQPRP
jgi:hypothetical protein